MRRALQQEINNLVKIARDKAMDPYDLCMEECVGDSQSVSEMGRGLVIDQVQGELIVALYAYQSQIASELAGRVLFVVGIPTLVQMGNDLGTRIGCGIYCKALTAETNK